MEWTPLEERTVDERKKARQLLDNLRISENLVEVYDELRWGLFKKQGTASFYKALTDMERLKKVVDTIEWISKEEKLQHRDRPGTSEQVDLDIEYEDIRDLDDKDLRSLNWVMKRAATESSRNLAKALYQRRLLELYISHVENTGETYYPQLRKELLLEYCDRNGIPMPE